MVIMAIGRLVMIVIELHEIQRRMEQDLLSFYNNLDEDSFGHVKINLTPIHILAEDRAQRYLKQNWKTLIYRALATFIVGNRYRGSSLDQDSYKGFSFLG